MTWWWAVTAVTAATGSFGWLVAALKRLAGANERTKQALTGCPASERAAVLEAAGRYAKSLGSRKVR